MLQILIRSSSNLMCWGSLHGRFSSIFLIFSYLSLLPCADSDFVWQQPQATRLPGGLLEWAPQPYVFKAGSSKRYIDYQAGDDHADGRSHKTAWKHHPWDSKSSAKAKACSGIHSYIFKGGSIYRGSLIADDSGSSSESIQLTRDPKWGKGAAIIAGSQRISSAWKKANDAPLSAAGNFGYH